MAAAAVTSPRWAASACSRLSLEEISVAERMAPRTANPAPTRNAIWKPSVSALGTPTPSVSSESVREFAEQEVAPHAEHIHRHDDLVPEAFIRKMGELGYFGLSYYEANADKLKPYEETRLKLESLVATAQGLTQQQAALTAAKQETSKKLKEVLNDAQRVATVLRFALREHYGKEAEKLVEFGVQPFRGRPRKQKGEPEKPQPEPPVPPAQ